MASKESSPAASNGSVIPPSTHFFQLNEIRSATDSDFEYFIQLAEGEGEGDGWIKKLDKNDITIWQKETGVTSIKMARACGEMPGVQASVAFDAILDGEYRRIWDGNVIDDYEHCRLDDCNDVGYYSMRCPPPLRNRDFVNQRSWRIISEDKFVIFNHSVSIKDLPLNKKFIRGISYITGFLIKSSENGCTLNYITQSDPRGNIPSWIINLTINKIAPSVFKKLNGALSKYAEWKAAHRPDYKPWRFPEQSTLRVIDPATLLGDGVIADTAASQAQVEEDLPEDEDKMKELADSIAKKLELEAASNGTGGGASNGNHLESEH